MGVELLTGCSAVSELLAAVVLAITTYFHHMRLLRLFTVLAAILAIFLSRAIARGMRAFVSLIFYHKTILLSDGLLLSS